MKKLFKLKNNENGQSMVEFALVLPILMLLVVGIIQFGFIFSVKTTLANEAREAVRYSAVGAYSEQQVKDYVKNSLNKNSLLTKYVSEDAVEIDISFATIDDQEQVTVIIVVEDFDLMVKKEAMDLSGKATMRIEPEIAGNDIDNNDPAASYDIKLAEYTTVYNKIVADLPVYATFNYLEWGNRNEENILNAMDLFSILKKSKDSFPNDVVNFSEIKWNKILDYYGTYLDLKK